MTDDLPDLWWSSYVYARGTCHPSQLAHLPNAARYEARYREIFLRGNMPLDTESGPIDLPYYLRKDANEIPGNLMWPTPKERAQREVSQRLNDALDRVEKHPDAKVAMPFWGKALPMIYGKKP